MVTNRRPREEVECFPPVVSETTFATFLPTPRHECGGTSPNMPDAAIHDPAGQAPIYVFLVISRGPTADWTIHVSSIHYFWTATRLETTSRSTATNLAPYH